MKENYLRPLPIPAEFYKYGPLLNSIGEELQNKYQEVPAASGKKSSSDDFRAEGNPLGST